LDVRTPNGFISRFEPNVYSLQGTYLVKSVVLPTSVWISFLTISRTRFSSWIICLLSCRRGGLIAEKAPARTRGQTFGWSYRVFADILYRAFRVPCGLAQGMQDERRRAGLLHDRPGVRDCVNPIFSHRLLSQSWIPIRPPVACLLTLYAF
jgi:hypothetical protein